MKKKYLEKIIIIIGALIVAFTLYNIHSRFKISEGGQLGIELLFYNCFGITPAISSFIFDFIFYLLGYIILGKKFLTNCIVGTISYTCFYYIFENLPFFLPDLSNNLLVASILGGILIGIGCGMVVKMNGACGGDDSLALVLSKITKLHISICYFLVDIIVILLSLIYIDISNILYSFLTALISSLIIGVIYNSKMFTLESEIDE